jgi:hypothetical protein
MATISLNDFTRLEDEGCQLAAPLGKVLHRVDHKLQRNGKHSVGDLLEGNGQSVDVRAIQGGDEGTVERLVHFGNDAVGLVLDSVYSFDNRLSVGMRRGCATIDKEGADLVSTGGAALNEVEEMRLPR